ncbi:MAG: hypothetical protein KDD36_01645 [Flavobacteriales bacterium]|nr:hypothetical protein [Flavobacteriales bacterium]
MKKHLVYALSFTLATVMAGCGGLGTMIKKADSVTINVTPNPLEMHGDTVKVAINGKIPPKYFQKKVIVKATPVLKYKDGGSKELKSVTLKGEKADGDGQVIKKAEGGSFSYNDQVKYEAGMKNCDLVLKIDGAMGSKTQSFPERKIAEGTIVTPLLVKSDEKPMFGQHNYENMPPIVHLAKIYYQKNSSNVRSSELNGDQMDDFRDFVAKYVKEEGTFQSVSTVGWASPEGSADLNEKLSEKRATTATSSIKGQLAKKKVAPTAKEDFFKESNKAGDWDGFKKLLDNSDLDAKGEVMNIVKNDPNPNSRDKKIREVSSNYKMLEKEIFPQLRRSEVRVSVKKKEFTQDQLKDYVFSTMDTLNDTEILYAATLFDDNAKKLQIYQAFASKYPDDWRGPNNVGAILLLDGKVSEAETEFKKAKVLAAEESAVVNNMGIIARRGGDVAKAMELYKSVSKPGAETSYNLGICSIIIGDYAAANKYLGEACDFNAGLAKLLSGNTAGAVKAVDCSDDAKTGLGYYLKAIAAARNGNKDETLSNLKSAIQADAKFKTMAKEDLEFHKFFEDAGFQAL